MVNKQSVSDAADFIHKEKIQMLHKFPELAVCEESSQARSKDEVIKYTLECSINNSRRMCFHDVLIKRDTPEERVDTLNLLTNAIGNAHRDKKVFL